jgi:catechol 2,3-dioxygenase-like lactoylglutathione lyase family enzyme
MVLLSGVLISTAIERYRAMRRFYVEILELPVRSDRDGFVNFDLGEGRLTVATHSEVSGSNADPARLMVNLRVDDLETIHRRMTASGVRFVREPEREKWGGTVATLVDPDGNYLQLFEFDRE